MMYPPSPAEVIEAAMSATGCDWQLLMDSTRRTGRASDARRLAAIVMRNEARMSYPDIAAALNLSSHGSVYRSINDTGHMADPIELELVAALAAKSAKARLKPRNEWALRPVSVKYLAAIERVAKLGAA